MFILHSKFGSKLASSVLVEIITAMITMELLDAYHTCNKRYIEPIDCWPSWHLIEPASMRLVEAAVMEDWIKIE